MTLKRNRPLIAGLLAVGGVILPACKSNPFPANANFAQTRPEPKVAQKPYGIDLPDLLEFNEGKKSSYPVIGWVPPPGQPVFGFSGLPEGAVFDKKSSTLSWTPGFHSANDPQDPRAPVRSYEVRVQLYDARDFGTVIEKTVVFLVHNQPQPFELEVPDPGKIREGEEKAITVSIANDDFPSGPFQLFVEGLPANALVKPGESPNQFEIRFTPDYHDVTSSDEFSASDSAFRKRLTVHFTVVNPAGYQETRTVEWYVYDVCLSPKISAPATIQAGTDLRFTLSAEDPNGEEAPRIELVSEPRFGEAHLEKAVFSATLARSNPVSQAILHWEKIPFSLQGQTELLRFRACVRQQSSSQESCSQQIVEVTVSAEHLSAPVISREAWPMGMRKFLRASGKATFRVPVRAAKDAAPVASVEVEPPELRNEISWNEDRLVIHAETPGLKNFNLVATSVQGRSRIEAFTLEILPAGWSRTLILGDSLRDPEIKSTLKFFPDAQVVNPSLTVLDDKLLALRSSLIIGTSALSEPLNTPQILVAQDAIESVFIHSPLLNALPPEFLLELKSAGLSLRGRLDSIFNPSPPGFPQLPPSLKDLLIKTEQGLSQPHGPVLLGGRLTAESINPMLLVLGQSGQCRTLFNTSLQEKLALGVKCKLDSGKNVTVIGFEWGDLLMDPVDQGISKKWLKEIQKL